MIHGVSVLHCRFDMVFLHCIVDLIWSRYGFVKNLVVCVLNVRVSCDFFLESCFFHVVFCVNWV